MICGLVLAAGRSRRMGTQKLLLPFGKSTVIGHIIDELLLSPLNEIVVVTRPQATAIKAALEGRPLTFISNPDPDAGMLSSVRCGLAALPQECDAVLLALGDQPGIRHEVVQRLIRAMRSSRRDIVVPLHAGRRGHPFLFSARYREEIMHGYGDAGMRGLLDAHGDDVLKVEIEGDWILDDIDYPDEYQKALNKSRES